MTRPFLDIRILTSSIHHPIFGETTGQADHGPDLPCSAPPSPKEPAMTTATAPVPRPVDETRLETDLGYRFGYLSEFMGFGPADVEAIHAAAPHLAPLVPALVD